MPSLKDLKNRITSVKSTRKITSAMKMVAASKLRRAQDQAMASRPYAEKMGRMLSTLAGSVVKTAGTSKLLTGTGRDDVVLLVVVTSDRGLCGGFNGSIVRETRKLIKALEHHGKQVKLLCVGRKGRDLLRRDHGSKIVWSAEELARKHTGFSGAQLVTDKILELFEAGEFDDCRIVFNHFKSAIAQIVTTKPIIPVHIHQGEAASGVHSTVEFEPDEEVILERLLPRNLAMQVYSALLESAAGEQGARMAAMDNATRNAGEMINKLTQNYNRSRQAYITKELIEIISGAEAV